MTKCIKAEMSDRLRPSKSVLQLAWQPLKDRPLMSCGKGEEQDKHLVAVASDDSSVRVLSIAEF